MWPRHCHHYGTADTFKYQIMILLHSVQNLDSNCYFSKVRTSKLQNNPCVIQLIYGMGLGHTGQQEAVKFC